MSTLEDSDFDALLGVNHRGIMGLLKSFDLNPRIKAPFVSLVVLKEIIRVVLDRF